MAIVSFKLAAIIGCLFILTGCWDIKTIQDINYVTAVGLDYEDGQYTVYVQMLDFTNIAKQEGGGKPTQEAPAFVGQGQGHSLGEAFDNLNRAAQQQMFWGHVSALVVGENLLKRGLRKEDFDSMIRFREIRFSQWIYGTKQPIPDIFNVKSFFNLSSLSTILHQPRMNHKQSSTISPMRFQKIIAQLQEPGNTVLLPSLGITTETWKKDTKREPILYKDGAFAIYKEDPSVFIDKERIQGTRLLEENIGRIVLPISSPDKPIGTIACREPEHSIHIVMEGDTPSFSITGKVNCNINELVKKEELDKLKQMVQKEIKQEIEAAYQVGKKLGKDVLSLEHALYKQDFRVWSRLTDNGKKQLTNYSLKSVLFKVKLIHSGMYKYELVKEENY